MWRTRHAPDARRQSPTTQPDDVEAGDMVPPEADLDELLEEREAMGKAEVSAEVPGSPVERIKRYNEDREPERLQVKYARMRSSAFGFYRGTSHLFNEDWPSGSLLDLLPAVWSSGDLHLENFGTYKADNRLAYFDIVDFDDAALAPAGRDLTRFVSSVILAGRDLKVGGRETIALTQIFLRSYAAALHEGKARWVERPTARGMVKDLLAEIKSRSRRELLDNRTELHGRARRLRVDLKHTLPVPEVVRGRIGAFMKKWAARQADPEFFQLLDVARRVAGVSSLGRPRFVLLVEGNGSPHRNFLLDLKISVESVMASRLQLAQPGWKNHAERIVAVQKRMQSVSPALLHPVLVNRHPYVIQELQPTRDRLNLSRWDGKIRRLEKIMDVMGEIVAWAQLRSSGREGSVITDELIDLGKRDGWQNEVVAYSRFYASRVESDYKEYCRAYDAGEFGEK
ncbi:MAG: DUF2252 family protein [Gemmatimonadota bacterium]